MNSWLVDYCCSQEGLFVIPIEVLSVSGIDPAFGNALEERGCVDAAWVTRFNRAWSDYCTRARTLSVRDPGMWLPPRPQHIAIVTEPENMRPYFQPFHQNSWLLYLQDFDSSSSSHEFSVFQFFQAERMGMVGSIVPAMNANLPYFLTLSSGQRKDFKRGCELTDRPDMGAWRALGTAQSWLKNLFHEKFRPPRAGMSGMRIQRENGLILPQTDQVRISDLQKAWVESAEKVFAVYRMRSGSESRSSADELFDWLSKKRPQALITGENGVILWDPEKPDQCDELRERLATLTERGSDRIRQDLEVVDHCSSRFLAALTDPGSLASPAPYMTEGGLTYIHPERRLIAYDIGPGRNENRLWESSPPFERLMLAARTIHEWGHLAAESGWVVVPESKTQQREELIQKLSNLFDEILAKASPAVRNLTRDQEKRLSEKHGSLGAGLLAAMLKRIEDYMANLVASRFLNPDEMDTYVRNNVASRTTEYTPDRVYLQLIRMVYEYQYLALSRIENPKKWFFESTWIKPIFIDRGILTRTQFEQIVDLVAEICGCFEIDETRFNFPGD